MPETFGSQNPSQEKQIPNSRRNAKQSRVMLCRCIPHLLQREPPERENEIENAPRCKAQNLCTVQ